MLQEGVKRAYKADLFLAMIQDARGQPLTAEQTRALMREKLQVLGPLLERRAPETLSPSIDRLAAILVRASMGAWAAGDDGIVPRPPEELLRAGVLNLKIEYVSEVAQAQKSVAREALRDHVMFAVATATSIGDPAILDNLDMDDVMEEDAEMSGVSPSVRRSDDDRTAMREQRAADAQAAQMVEAAPGVAKAAKDMAGAGDAGQAAVNRLLGSQS
jgi:hypothetical protein